MNRYKLKIYATSVLFTGVVFSLIFLGVGYQVHRPYVLVLAPIVGFIVGGCYGLWLGDQVWKKEKLKQTGDKS
jgi:membrane associated rhomboid family serine protease